MSKLRKFKSMLFGDNKQMPCMYCSDLLDFENATVEHLISRSSGGTNHLTNLNIACAACNNGHKNPLDIKNNSLSY